MPIDSQLFRAAMGRLVTGVTVLAAREPDGALIGMTASAVTSLSLDPPMLLACVGHAAAAYQALVSAERFSVNVLGTDQQDLSQRFATRDLQRFAGIAYDVTPAGLPWLRGALACLECRRDAVHEGGDHSIVTGVVEWARTADGDPLLYFLGGYRRIGA
jgi:flavin reductase (DIM6/NTAB) family NADH-FMN oxidoreductase RutF